MGTWLAFYRGRGRFVSDTVVRWVTNAGFSHVELVLSDMCPAPGSTHACASSSGRDGGVRTKDITFNPTHWEFVEVPWAPSDAWAKITQHQGSKYDYQGLVLSQLFNLRRHRPDRWFCSEMCGHALGLSDPHTLSPGDLHRLVADMTRVYEQGRTQAAHPQSA